MTTIDRIGTTLGPDVLEATRRLFDQEQHALAGRVPAVAADLAYGPDERHRLDLYGTPASAAPVILFVHGGGFLKGDKAADGWPNAAVGRWAAEQGFLGAVMNYRLAPDHAWPAGGEDVLAAIDWLAANAGRFGGDPQRIVLVGTSAGAVHGATAVRLRPDLAVRGLALMSGLYGYTPLDARDTFYYGDEALYPARMPRDAVVATTLPILLACAEYDPPRFQAEWAGLIRDRLAQHGHLPRCHYASGHNHYSMALHLGTSDRRLADELADFVRNCCR
ncbi:alpha/beta hydrolase [Novosphingobium flavum]|uniref:Alpha/beta hydrolase n=1 Tax=Novosphingobium aerophilum TaxID=2839843 RepID=A0A7X1KD41_9SPHN|nr:alpha/beta hydrolase [Novosphingobium aerophilum]MBC2652955.1 alpha/beta hydrolase [Novosphingobium aerophilum]MBC2662035.1 alpha/beta hydrolase [Novosphingobium aerophilum]